MQTFWDKIKANHLEGLESLTTIGIEREAQRVDTQGHLALSDHPASLGDRAFHPYLQTDFAESQTETITDTHVGVTAVMEQLQGLTATLARALPKDERLWLQTMPPVLPGDLATVPVAHPSPERLAYRQKLIGATGDVRQQMMSSVHLNLSLPETLFERLYEAEDFGGQAPDYVTYRNQIYVHLSQQWLLHRSVITYLFGASPLANSADYPDAPKQPVRSLHSSRQFGYHNPDDVQVRYSSAEAYANDIAAAVQSGSLISAANYYGGVRLRGENLTQTGIEYLEFRDFDLNPFVVTSLSPEELQFVVDYVWFLFSQPMLEANEVTKKLTQAATDNERMAMADPFSPAQNLVPFFDEMAEWLNAQQPSAPRVAAFTAMQDRILHPEQTPAARLTTLIQASEYQHAGLQLADELTQSLTAEPYLLPGYTDMEQSTQMLIEDSYRLGLKVDLLDRDDQLVQLTLQDHQEWVRAGNETRLDSLVVSRLVDDKLATKAVLGAAKLPVARAAVYHDWASARADFVGSFLNKSIVVKPKSSNVGAGVTIFAVPPAEADFKRAFDFAHEYGDVLVELFIKGTEYRFFVVGDQVRAILERIPANVVGDGQHTIAELVDKKNQDPRRGDAHRKPLQTLRLEDRQLQVLASQGLTPDSVPLRGHQAFLLTNSNISTGGDSYDVTDEMDASYKKLAVQASQALQQTISGVDIIIPNLYVPYEPDKGMATIVESNYNPAMFMHLFPYMGEPRRVTLDVITTLFPELPESGASFEA
ncbi:bifunctional glutamate--cysteine ligase GshA/glutathione synthetase GshB [Lacticaseibacillus brantae]|nr:bifunctional glutamate--cysteine ligase GshA/glutathione synthetase GshB [Lacticaseibacillus brantae]